MLSTPSYVSFLAVLSADVFLLIGVPGSCYSPRVSTPQQQTVRFGGLLFFRARPSCLRMVVSVAMYALGSPAFLYVGLCPRDEFASWANRCWMLFEAGLPSRTEPRALARVQQVLTSFFMSRLGACGIAHGRFSAEGRAEKMNRPFLRQHSAHPSQINPFPFQGKR